MRLVEVADQRGREGRVGGDVGVYEGHLGDAERDNPSWDVRLLGWRTRAAGFRGKIIRFFLRAATFGAARRCHLAASSPSIQFYEYNRARPAATRRAPRRPFQVTKRRRERRARRDVRRGDISDASALASVDASHGARGARQRRDADATRLESRVVSRRFSATSATLSRGARVVGVVDGRDTRRDGRDASVSRSSSVRVRRDQPSARSGDETIGEAFVFVLRAKETETRLASKTRRFFRRGFAV